MIYEEATSSARVPPGEADRPMPWRRRRSLKKHFWLASAWILSSGCAISIPPPTTAAGAPASPEKAWGLVLSRFVDEKGRIDFAGMAKDPADLETYVAFLARVSPASDPQSFPTPQARLAFYINAYNALAMFDVLRSGQPPDLGAVKVRFFYRNRFRLGGSSTSLYHLENEVIRPMGDPRVHAALNCMARGCPRLPREPFRADLLDAQLDAGAREFFNEERNVKLEPERATVRFSQILEFYASDFLKKAPSLIAFADDYREQKIPADWKVEFLPYDWRLNAQ
jgi:hypothetical protein